MDLRIHCPIGIIATIVIVILVLVTVVVAKQVEILAMVVMVHVVIIVATITMVVERGTMAREMHMINFTRIREKDHRINSMVNIVTQSIIHILLTLIMMTMAVTVTIETIMDMEGGMEVHHTTGEDKPAVIEIDTAQIMIGIISFSAD